MWYNPRLHASFVLRRADHFSTAFSKSLHPCRNFTTASYFLSVNLLSICVISKPHVPALSSKRQKNYSVPCELHIPYLPQSRIKFSNISALSSLITIAASYICAICSIVGVSCRGKQGCDCLLPVPFPLRPGQDWQVPHSSHVCSFTKNTINSRPARTLVDTNHTCRGRVLPRCLLLLLLC